MYDARRTLRAALVAKGYLEPAPGGRERGREYGGDRVNGRSELDRFLRTDPRDVGCDETLRILHIYVELVLEDESGPEAGRRYPGVAAHLLACGPCSDDFEGLLMAARTEGDAGPD